MAGTAPQDLSLEAIQTIHAGRRGEPMGPERLQIIVDEAISDAESFVDEDIAPEREMATSYYYAKPMGNEIAGRSTIVMSEVRDVVHMLLPGLMRVFTGSEHVVEFTPVEQSDVANAEQATDYVDHIFSKDNNGFQIIYDAATDGLVKKTGIIKWWYEKNQEVSEERYDGLTIGQVAMLANDPEVEIIAIGEIPPRMSGESQGGY
jgi:hypothetical protein